MTPDGNSIAVGSNQQLVATGIYANGTSTALTNVTWSTSSSSTASVSSTGLATANAPGAATITANADGVSGTAAVFVSSKTLSSVSLTPVTGSVAAGASQQFHFVGTFSDGSTQDLTSSATWSSGTAAAANVSTLGLATGIAIGSSTISATFQGFTASSTLTVTAAAVIPPVGVNLVAIQVTPNGNVLVVNTTQQFTATGIYSNGSSQVLSNVTWTSTSGAAINSASGLATATNTGESTVTATASGLSGSAALFVSTKTLSSVALTPSTPSIAAGTTQQFRFVGTFSDGSTQDLTSSATWTSGTPGAAVVSSLGLATGLASGTTTITATFGSSSANTNLTVTAAKLVSIAITSAGAPSIANGTTVQLGATGTFSDGTVQNITSTVTWASTNAGVASVNASGLATGVSPGTTSITATSSGVVGTTSLTVNPVTIVSLVVSPISPTVPLGTTTQLRAIGFFSDNSSQDLTTQSTWSSSANATVNVSNVAPTQGVLTPVAAGTANVTATYVGPNNSASGSSNVTVTPATLVSLSITPALSQVTLGSPVTFQLMGVYSDNSTQNLGSAPYPVNVTYVPRAGLFSANGFFSATPNVTSPGGNAASAINATTGVFSTNVTGNFIVTATLNNSTSALNGTSATTNITITQPPASGPLLFTGFNTGTINANAINPETGALTSVGGYPYTVGANPVSEFLTNPEQSVLYVSTFLPGTPAVGASNGTSSVLNVTSLVVSQAGNITLNATAPFVGNVANPPTGAANGDFGIIENFQGTVFPQGNSTLVSLTPFFPDGTIVSNALSSTNTSLGTGINALTSWGNYLFTTDGSNVYSYDVTTFGVFQISSVPVAGLTELTTDPDGHILVGINSAVGSNPSINNLAVFTINQFGQLSLVQQAITHLITAPTKVRTNGNLIFVLSNSSTEFETFYYNPNTTTLNSLGTQYSGNNPVDVDFDPTNQYLYVANYGDGTVSAFAIANGTYSSAGVNATTFGAVSGSPFTVGAKETLTSLRVFR